MTLDISIVIPTYNRAELVRETVVSVLEQTFESYEVVVVDDGSTDNTKEVLRDFVEAEKIRYIFQENSGRSNARNHGMASSTSQYLMFLDSDDLLFPISLELLLDAAHSHPAAGLVAGKRIFIDETGDKIEMTDPVSVNDAIYAEDIQAKKIRELFFPPSAYIVKRELAEKVGGYDSTVEPAEDLDFFIKCCDLAPITVLPIPVVKMRRHEGNTSDITLRKISLRISRKNLDRLTAEPKAQEIGQLGKLKSEWLIRMGDDSYALDRNLDAFRYYFRAVTTSPGFLADLHVGRQLAASAFPASVKRLVKKFLGRKS